MNSARSGLPRVSEMHPAGTPSIELVRYPSVRPIFILGSVRSGTSAVMSALRDGAGVRGFNEGVLAHLLPTLLSAVQKHYAYHMQKPMTMLGSVGEDFLAIGIKNLFGKAFIETMGEGRWLDKTPAGAGIINASPILLEIFPQARFVFCKRRGVENVLSRQNKFPAESFNTHCRSWASTMEAWLKVAPRLGERAIVIDQRDMAIEPEEVSRRLAAHLDLSAEEREGALNRLRGKRVQQTRPARDDVAVALADTGWATTEQETFRRVCGPMMDAFGYGMDGGCGDAQPSAYRFFVPIADGSVQRENISSKRGCRAVDATSFKIDANAAAEPVAGIRHRAIEMERFRSFSARVRCIGPGARQGLGLVFSIALERSGDNVRVFLAEQTVTAGPPSLWQCELPQLNGSHDAILSVRRASSADEGPISSLWIDAQLS